MQKLIIFALCAVGVVFCYDTTPVEDCPTSPAGFLDVQIFTYKGLCTELPCTFYRGDDVTALVHFLNPFDDVREITKRVNATVAGLTIEFPLPNATKGCDDLQEGYNCPVYAGDDLLFKLTMPVSTLYPKVDLILDFFMTQQDKLHISSFRTAAKVEDKPDKILLEEKKPAPIIQKLLRNAEPSKN